MTDLDGHPHFAGKYVPIRRIADNPRTLTLAVTDAATGRACFLKLAQSATCDDPALLRAFHDEPAILRLLARHAGPDVVLPVLDEDRWDGRPYFVQPLVEGWRLASAMRTWHPFLATSVLHVMERCLGLLSAIHGAGIVHGDISPENIMIATSEPETSDGRLPPDCDVRIVDFDVARRYRGPENRPGAYIVGKLPYMAPELLARAPLSPLTDLYSLGVVFYEMLAGGHPHAVQNLRDVAALNDEKIPPISLALDVPTRVEKLVRRLLAINPDRRFASAAEALYELRELSDVHRWLSRTEPPRPLREGTVRRSPKLTNVKPAETGGASRLLPLHLHDVPEASPTRRLIRDSDQIDRPAGAPSQDDGSPDSDPLGQLSVPLSSSVWEIRTGSVDAQTPKIPTPVQPIRPGIPAFPDRLNDTDREAEPTTTFQPSRALRDGDGKSLVEDDASVRP